jgi:rhamnosyltransferase
MKTASVIVTFNPETNLLARQLKSISVFTSVFLVDNSSSNIDAISMICKDISDSICIIQLAENMGLGFAQNRGIEEVLKGDYSHVMLFDQDSYLSENSFNSLMECERSLLKRGVNLGAIGPVCIDPGSKSIYPITEYWGPFIKRKFLKGSELCQASFLVASGSLIRVPVLKQIGFMKDELFIDYIDVEWCYRAQSMGFELYATSDSVLEHHIGDARVSFFGRSISMHSALRRYYLTRNCFRILALQYIPIGYKLREVSLLFARILAFFYLSNERLRYSKFMIQAFSDAIRGRYGKIKQDA